MLVFADLYPEENAEVILVDSVHEVMLKEIAAPRPTLFNRPGVRWLLTSMGYQRLMGPTAEIEEMFCPLPETARRSYVAQMNKTNYRATVDRELSAFSESLQQLERCHAPIKQPLTVITAGKTIGGEEGGKWFSMQEKLLLKSGCSRQVIAEHSDHMINHHEPEVIVSAIHEMINDLHGAKR